MWDCAHSPCRISPLLFGIQRLVAATQARTRFPRQAHWVNGFIASTLTKALSPMARALPHACGGVGESSARR